MTTPVMLHVRGSKSNAMANVHVQLVARNSASGTMGGTTPVFAVKMDRLMTTPVMLNVRRSKSNAVADVRVQ